jgi:IstB-like ATP binding protein
VQKAQSVLSSKAANAGVQLDFSDGHRCQRAARTAGGAVAKPGAVALGGHGLGDRRLLQEVYLLRLVANYRNLTILVPVGGGKTFWLQAIARLCCEASYHVRFGHAESLLRSLWQRWMDNSRELLMTVLTTADVLALDDFALEPMGRKESRDIYQLFVDRTARIATIVSINRDTP